MKVSNVERNEQIYIMLYTNLFFLIY